MRSVPFREGLGLLGNGVDNGKYFMEEDIMVGLKRRFFMFVGTAFRNFIGERRYCTRNYEDMLIGYQMSGAIFRWILR